MFYRQDVTALETYFPNVLQEKIAEYLAKHNLVFSGSPTTQNKDIVKNLVQESMLKISTIQNLPLLHIHTFYPQIIQAQYTEVYHLTTARVHLSFWSVNLVCSSSIGGKQKHVKQ